MPHLMNLYNQQAVSRSSDAVRYLAPIGVRIAVCLLAVSSGAALGGWIQTEEGSYDYLDTANWDSGIIDYEIPSTLTLSGTQTLTFDADHTTSGDMLFLYSGGHPMTLIGAGGDRTLTLGGDLVQSTSSGGANIEMGSITPGEGLHVDLGGAVRTVSNNRAFRFSSAVIGTGGLVKTGGSTLYLGGGTGDEVPNTFEGVLEITQGTVQADKANDVIAIPCDVVIDGGSLNVRGRHGQTASEIDVTVHDGVFSVAGTRAQQGTRITVANVYALGEDARLGVGAGSYGGSTVTVTGDTIVSNATLNAVGKGANWTTDRLILWGRPNSTSLVVRTTDNNGGAIAVIGAGGWTIHQPESGLLTAARVSCNTSNRDANLRLNGDVTLHGNAANTEPVLIVEDGSQPRRFVGLNGTRTFTVHPGGGEQGFVIEARLQNSGGTGGVIKDGEGTLVLANTCSYTGPTTIQEGMLRVNGGLTDVSDTVEVEAGGTLGGTGEILRTVQVNGGRIDPGAVSDTPGALTLGGDLVFDDVDSGTLRVGFASASDYGRIVMTNPDAQVRLEGATLQGAMVDGFSPAADTEFVIIDNQGAHPIQGTFDGLPENSSVTLDGRLFRITYQGGDGNDVVLSAMQPRTILLIR